MNYTRIERFKQPKLFYLLFNCRLKAGVYMDDATPKTKVIINQLLITHGGSAPYENTIDCRWSPPLG